MVVAVVVVAAALAVLAAAGDDGGPPAGPEPSPSGGPATPLGGVTGDLPPAPWRAAPVPRTEVPPAFVSAWERAGNRGACRLLFPLDGGPALDGAGATGERTPEDRGWDIFLAGAAGSVEVLGLFDKASGPGLRADVPKFTKTWSDGSVARYQADAGKAAPGTYDPNTSAFEAELTLPDQACAYRIYDTLGKAHLEYVFDRLRLMAP